MHTSITPQLIEARKASRELLLLSDERINEILLAVARETEQESDIIIEANKKDLDKMDLRDPKYDRLLLNKERITAIANDIRNVATLPSPLNTVLEESIRPNGMRIRKVVVPFGVIGVIYEARPNVSFDVFSLCFKTANSCILKGGSDAEHSNKAIVDIIHKVLKQHQINPAVCTLLPATREATSELLNATGYVDLLIPRGSSALINYVRDHARIPVIETGAGICHIYFDKSGNLLKGASIINNAKTRRVSVCNALDCLLINQTRLSDLPQLVADLAKKQVIIYADPLAYTSLCGIYPDLLLHPADSDTFGTEFLDYKLAIKTVSSLEDALNHIERYSSKHSEAVIAEDETTKDIFRKMVDAACVYTNTSTSFTDGAQFGFGAEIGISTQKLHARGPMALREITSYKYIIDGEGQIRL
ncbi:MAG: glutamate-5-semialdehyde dehydrogenase [Bacteroidales bacterium]